MWHLLRKTCSHYQNPHHGPQGSLPKHTFLPVQLIFSKGYQIQGFIAKIAPKIPFTRTLSKLGGRNFSRQNCQRNSASRVYASSYKVKVFELTGKIGVTKKRSKAIVRAIAIQCSLRT